MPTVPSFTQPEGTVRPGNETVNGTTTDRFGQDFGIFHNPPHLDPELADFPERAKGLEDRPPGETSLAVAFGPIL